MNMGGRRGDEMRDPGLNQTKDMLSGVDGGMGDSGGDMMGRGEQMGGMSMGHEGNKGNQMRGDNQGGNPLSKMSGMVGGKGSNTHDNNPSMGEKMKGTFEQAKGKLTNDPQTARRGEMRKQPGGGDSADIMGGAGI